MTQQNPPKDSSFWRQIKLLGGVDLIDNQGKQHSFTYRRSGLLLAYLALAGDQRGHARNGLATLLWPDKSTPAAKANLRQILADLKRTLGACLDTRGDTVALKPAWLTLIDAAQLAQPLPTCPLAHNCKQTETTCSAHLDYLSQLYSGELLTEMLTIAEEELADWLDHQQVALHRQIVMIEQYRFRCHRDGGRVERALQAARRYSLLAPHCETGQQQLLELLARLGHYQQALTEFEHFRERLMNDIDVEPSEELQALAAQLSHQAKGRHRPLPSLRDNRQQSGLPQREIRQVTVMVIEINIASAFQDDAADRLEPVVEHVSERLRLAGGHVIHPYGGSLLAYFSYPQAREESASQAARAAKRIADSRFADSQIRIGIHTGDILTGRDADVPDTVGETTRLATQLQLIAEPGEILVSQSFQSLVKTRYVLDYDASRKLGGLFSSRFKAYTLLQRKTIREQQAGLPEPLGIDPLLVKLCQQLLDGQMEGNKAVRLSGPAGSGKSLVGAWLRQQSRKRGHTVMWMEGDVSYRRQALHPLLKLFSDIGNFDESAPFEIQLGQLVALIEQYTKRPPADWMPTLAHWLHNQFASLDALDSGEFDQAAPTTITDLFKEFLIGWKGQQRWLLLVLDDAHWSDQSTLDLLAQLLREGQIRLLLIHRDRADRFEQHSLFNDAVSTEMPGLPDSVLRDILLGQCPPAIEPNSLDHLVWLSAGRGGFAFRIGEDVANTIGWATPIRFPQLQDLLTASYDALGGFRFVAQVAAILGMEFDSRLLERFCAITSRSMARALKRMQAVHLIEPLGGDRWRFQHPLYWEAGFRSRPKEERDRLRQELRTSLDEQTVAHLYTTKLMQPRSSTG